MRLTRLAAATLVILGSGGVAWAASTVVYESSALTSTQVPKAASTADGKMDASSATDDGTTWSMTSAWATTGVITPTALSGNVNDYAPTGLSAAGWIRQDGGAADRTITGLTGGVAGRRMIITNIGSTNVLILSNNSGSSSAANRFLMPADTTLAVNASMALIYDGVANLWKPADRSLSNSGVTAGSYTCASVTVGVDGRATSASSGCAALATGTSVSLTAPRQYYVCTGTCTVTPPVPAAGYEFCVLNGDNVATVITMAAIGSSAQYENTARTAYGTAGTGTFVSGGAVADRVCLLGLDSTHYLTLSYNGTWTAN